MFLRFVCVVVTNLFLVQAQYFYPPSLLSPSPWTNPKPNYYSTSLPLCSNIGALAPPLLSGPKLPSLNIPPGCVNPGLVNLKLPLPPVCNVPSIPVPAPSIPLPLNPLLPSLPSPNLNSSPGFKCNPPTAFAFYLPKSSSPLTPPLNPVLPLTSVSPSCSTPNPLPTCSYQPQPSPCQSLSQSQCSSCPFCKGVSPLLPNPKLQPPPSSSSVLPGIIDEIPTISNRLKQPLSIDSEPLPPPVLPELPSLPELPFSPSLSSSKCTCPLPPSCPIKNRYDLDLLNGFLNGLGF